MNVNNNYLEQWRFIGNGFLFSFFLKCLTWLVRFALPSIRNCCCQLRLLMFPWKIVPSEYQAHCVSPHSLADEYQCLQMLKPVCNMYIHALVSKKNAFSISNQC